jgi:hypothetical protein
MNDDIDCHGQPYNVRFNRARRAERDLSELLGLAKGVLADGVVNEPEAEFIRQWVETHPDAAIEALIRLAGDLSPPPLG